MVLKMTAKKQVVSLGPRAGLQNVSRDENRRVMSQESVKLACVFPKGGH